MFPFKAFVKLWRHQSSLALLCPYRRTDASAVGWAGFRIWKPCSRISARRSPNCGNLSAQMVVSMVDPRASVKGSLVAAVVGVAIAELMCVNAAVAQPSCRRWNTTAFFETATVADVSRCLKAGANIHQERAGGWTHGGWTPLHSAAVYSKSPEVVKTLLDAGANTEARAVNSHTPLHSVAYNGGSPEVVKVLLDAGANIEALNSSGMTPLNLATYSHTPSPEVVKALLDAGANIQAQPRSMRAAVGRPPLACGSRT